MLFFHFSLLSETDDSTAVRTQSVWSLMCPADDLTANGTLLWFRHGTATPCFTDGVGSLSLYILAACTAWSLGERGNDEFVRLPLNWRLRFRRVIASALMALCVLYLLIVQLVQGHELFLLRYVNICLTMLVWVYHLACYLQHKRKNELHITFSSAFCTLCSALRSYSLFNELWVLKISSDPLSYYVELYCSLGSTIMLLIYTCLTVRPWTSVPSRSASTVFLSSPLSTGYIEFAQLDEEVGILGEAEADSNIFSLLSFWWVGRLMRRGFLGKLSQTHDLFDVPLALNAYELVHRFPGRPGRGHLINYLNQLLGVHFYALGLLKFMTDMCALSGPLLLHGLVSSFEQRSSSPGALNTYLYAAIMGGTAFMGAMFNTHCNYQLEKIKLKLKTTLVTTLYEKTLAVKFSNHILLPGKALNLMTADADRIAGFCSSFHMLWSLPLQIAVTLYMLYAQVGMAFIAGVGFVVVLIPINRWLANRIGTLSSRMLEAKDKRVSLVREVLRGMLYLKMHSWVNLFKAKILLVREKEVKELRGRKYLDAWCVFFWATSPILMSVLTFMAWAILKGNPTFLSAATIFTTLSLLNLLIVPLNAFPWVLNGIIEAKVSLDRMQSLMNAEDFKPGSYYADTLGSPDVLIRFTGASFSYDEAGCDTLHSDFHLGPLTFALKKGELFGVVGEVGSGKSSLLSAIIGGMSRTHGTFEFSSWHRMVAFVPQTVWLQKTTIRNNILFGNLFDSTLYDRVVQACALLEDFKDLPEADFTDVGEDGSRLSGGQRVRVSLARAAYSVLIEPSDEALVLLDDPFLSLDVNVANHIYHECICGLLVHSTRVLVTHHSRFLKKCSTVLGLSQGRQTALGTPEQVMPLSTINSFLPSTENSLDIFEETVNEYSLRSEESLSAHHADGANFESCKSSIEDSLKNVEEDCGKGHMSAHTVWFYVRSIGTTLSVLTVAVVMAMQISRTATDAWLAYYVSPSEPSLQKLHLFYLPSSNSAAKFYEGYLSLALSSSLLALFRAFVFAFAGLRAAVLIHDRLLETVMHAPLGFFERTPLGRILNRLSSDVFTVDDSLPFIVNILLAVTFSLTGTLILTCYGLPWILLLLPPLALCYTSVQRYYRYTSRELKRLSSVALSPLFSHLSETLSGLNTIRAFTAQRRFVNQLLTRLNAYNQCEFSSVAASQWLGLRLQMIGVVLTFGVAILSVVEHHRVDPITGETKGVNPAIVGLVLSYMLSITSQLSSVVTAFAETEREMISVERIQNYVDATSTSLLANSDEADDLGSLVVDVVNEAHTVVPPFGWPVLGWLRFENVTFSYSKSGPAVLHDLSFELPAGQRLGVVGRTGAGKSSLVQALFRLRPLRNGTITIDGLDIRRVSVDRLRSRIACVPQDAFVFVGSIRDNLDPAGQHSDEDLWSALELCSIRDLVVKTGGLDGFTVQERGDNLSTGQRQLLCLARAVLAKTRVVCMDEATSGVDRQTEVKIQRILKSNAMRSVTVIYVAHRVQSVLDLCDLVAVMNAGRIVQFGPSKDLANVDGPFKELLQNSR